MAMREQQILVCVDNQGYAHRKFIFTRLEKAALDLEAAAAAGFVLTADGMAWVRELTPDIVAREIREETWAEIHLFPEKQAWEAPNESPTAHPRFSTTLYREAWKLNATKTRVVHDMPKARDLRRDELRLLREPKMLALDIEYTRADARGDRDEKVRVEAKRQALRDVTDDPAIDTASTPEQLSRVLPAALRDGAKTSALNAAINKKGSLLP